MGILTEQEMYFRAAERAFYRNPFSDLLIVSLETLNRDDDEWKGLNLPVLLVSADGTLPGATRREIARRRNPNLFVWGDPEVVPDSTLDALEQITRGKVYRITRYAAAKEVKPDQPALDGDGDSAVKEATEQPGAGQEQAAANPPDGAMENTDTKTEHPGGNSQGEDNGEILVQAGEGQDPEVIAPVDGPPAEAEEIVPEAEQAGELDTEETPGQRPAEQEPEIAPQGDEPGEKAADVILQPEDAGEEYPGEITVQHQAEQEQDISNPPDGHPPKAAEEALQPEEAIGEDNKELTEPGAEQEPDIVPTPSGKPVDDTIILQPEETNREDVQEPLPGSQADHELETDGPAGERPEVENEMPEELWGEEESAEAVEKETETNKSATSQNVLVWRFPS